MKVADFKMLVRDARTQGDVNQVLAQQASAMEGTLLEIREAIGAAQAKALELADNPPVSRMVFLARQIDQAA